LAVLSSLAGHHTVARRREGDGIQRLGVAGKCRQRRKRAGIPNAGRSILACRCEAHAVGAVGDARQLGGVAFERGQPLT